MLSKKMEYFLRLLQDLNSIHIATILIALLFSYYLLRSYKLSQSKTAPKAAGSWPILGHLPLLRGSKNLPHKTLANLADKYGPIFMIQLGSHLALVVSNWELAKECYNTNDMVLSSRPKRIACEILGYNYAMFVFAPYGPYWRELRKIATLEILSHRRIELLRPLLVSEVEVSIKELYQFWAKQKSDSIDHVLVDLKQWFGRLTLNFLLRVVAGKRYAGAGEEQMEEAHRCIAAIRRVFELLGVFVVADALPYLRWLDLGGHEKEMKKTAKELDGILIEWLEGHKQKRGLMGESSGEQDFMDVMLSILDDGSEIAGYDKDTIVKATSMTLIAGGSDTTMVALTWAISLLLNNPQTLKKAKQELDDQVGTERFVKESDINNLPYLQAIVKETLRLQPPAPLSGTREFINDCTIGGYHVPKGTRLIMNLWKIQTDSRVWHDPFMFKPERFLSTHKDVDVRGFSFELLPFGSGRRACPGISLGLEMVQFMLASFLHAFDISNPTDLPIDMSESFGLTNVRASPLEVILKPHLPCEVYEINYGD